MHKCICTGDNHVSSTTPESYSAERIIDSVSSTIEDLDIQLYNIITCKSKLDEVMKHLNKLCENHRSVPIPIATEIMRIKRSFSNSGVGPCMESFRSTLTRLLSSIADDI